MIGSVTPLGKLLDDTMTWEEGEEEEGEKSYICALCGEEAV